MAGRSRRFSPWFFDVIETNIWLVFFAALLTAVATGIGALPFLFLKTVSLRAISLANAVAAGLMFAATHGLVSEGIALSPARLMLGILIGLAGILLAKNYVSNHDKTSIASFSGLDASKAFLIIAVMTAHSFAEGVGVGVSFGGSGTLAAFITAAIAVHNIPEGLAISLVLVPRGTPVWQAALWSIFSSLPQPIAAVPSYLFVETFEPFLPIGLGIAAGAMIWMVFSELIPDANAHASPSAVGTTITLCFVVMLAFQYLVLKG